MTNEAEQTETAEATLDPEPSKVPKSMSPDEYQGLLANLTGGKGIEQPAAASTEMESEEIVEEDQEEPGVAEAEEEEVAEEEQPQPQPKAKPAKDGVAFTLPDGTKVTHKEAKDGYMMRRDYTNKTMEVADKRKKLEKYEGIINYLENNPDEVEHYIERMKGKGKQVATVPVKKVVLPEAYKNDPFLAELVEGFNELREQVAQKADVGAIKAATTEQQKQLELGRKINERLSEAYSYISDKLGKQPNPQEYEDKIKAYLTDKQMSPEDLSAYILGPDPDYMKGFVERVYQNELAKVKKGKTGASGEKPKVSQEKKAVLKSSGKSTGAGTGFQVPKTRDGKVDSYELSRADPSLHAFLKGAK